MLQLRSHSWLSAGPPIRSEPHTARSRKLVQIHAKQGGWKPFDGDDKSKEEAARKALQDSMGGKLGFNKQGKEKMDAASMFSEGGGGPGGAGNNFLGTLFGDDGYGFNEFMSEFIDILRGIVVVGGNLLLFLALADFMHRTLDWCAETEVLFLIGAGQQAIERITAQFFMVIEWLERNLLGWRWDDGRNVVPKYEVVKYLYNNDMFVVFEQYKHKLLESERQLLGKKYAIKYWERPGGYKGDVSDEEVQRIKQKYEPEEADRQDFLRARSAGRLEEYWNATPQRRAIFEKYYLSGMQTANA